MSGAADVIVLGAVGYLSYRLLMADKSPDEISPTVGIPPGWKPINEEYRVSAIGEIAVFRVGVDPVKGMPYWVLNDQTMRYELCVWDDIFQQGGSFLTGWVPCQAGELVVVDIAGQKGVQGAEGPPGVAASRANDVVIQPLTVLASTTTLVTGNTPVVPQRASVAVTFDLVVSFKALASTATIALTIHSGTTLVATLNPAFVISADMVDKTQYERVTVVIPATGLARDLNARCVVRQAQAILEGVSYE